jgi:hypothetical protein
MTVFPAPGSCCFCGSVKLCELMKLTAAVGGQPLDCKQECRGIAKRHVGASMSFALYCMQHV